LRHLELTISWGFNRCGSEVGIASPDLRLGLQRQKCSVFKTSTKVKYTLTQPFTVFTTHQHQHLK